MSSTTTATTTATATKRIADNNTASPTPKARKVHRTIPLIHPDTTTPIQQQLAERGFCVVPIYEETLDNFDVDYFLSDQVEFVDSGTRQMVMGGFGAYAHPSSYHHPKVRQLRHAVWGQIRDLFRSVYPGHTMQCLPDRFCVRLKELSVSAESWHRDVSLPYNNPSLVACYGGWVNLDVDLPVTQYFSCVPGSHRDVIPADLTGFDKASDEIKGRCEAEKQLVVVPPGHGLLFNERLLHEIAKRPQPVDTSFRQYFKYVVSTAPLDVFGVEEVDRCLDTMASFPLHETFDKKGQRVLEYPPMYAGSHPLFHATKLEAFSKTLLPQFTYQHKQKKKNKNKAKAIKDQDQDQEEEKDQEDQEKEEDQEEKTVTRVYRHPPSLRDAGLGHVFRAYTSEERKWYRPFLLDPIL